MNDLPRESTVVSDRRAWLALVLLLASYVVFDVLVDPLYRNTSAPDRERVIAVMLGAVFSQPVLLAIWSVFGAGPGRLRVPLTIGAFAIVLLANFMVSWLKYGNSMGSPTQNPRLLVALCALYVVFFVVALPVIFLTKVRIRPAMQTWLSEGPANQYSIRYLLGLTAAIAVLLGVGRGAAKSMAGAGVTVSPGSFSSLATDCGVVLLLVTGAIALPLVVLAQRWNVLLVVVFVLNWLLLTFVSLQILGAVYPNPPSNLTERVLFIQLGATLNALASSIVLRLAGYRFVRREPTLPKD